MSPKLRRAIQAINRASSRCGYLAAAVALGGLSTAPAFAQTNEAAELEEVVVTGIRRSLQDSMDIKRFSSAVVDAVSAEDVGKFPDKNVAESLARIPGVTISRTFGEGQGVTIRGLGAGRNLTLVNGQAVGTSQWFILADATRNFNYELLASEMLAGVEVYKSAQADIDEGGLGGTVNLKTRRPLDMEAGEGSISVEAQYGDLSEETDPSFSGLYSWKNEDETFGASIVVSRQERTVRREATEMFVPAYFTQFDRDWNAATNPGTPFNPPAGASEQGLLPWGIGSALFTQERERTGVDLNLQWKPNDNLSLGLHYLNSELKADNVNSNFIGIPFRGIFAANNPSEGVVENGIVTELHVDGGDPAAWANHIAYDTIYRPGSKMDTEVVDLDLEFSGDNFTIEGRLGTTSGEGTNNDFFTEFFASSQDPRANFDFYNPGGQAPRLDYSRSPWLASPTTEMSLTGVFDQQNIAEDSEDYAQIDVSFDVAFGAVNEIKVGGKIRDRSFEQTRYRDELQNAVVGTESLGYAGDLSNGTITVAHDETSMGSLTVFNPDLNGMRNAFFNLPVCDSSGELCRTGRSITNESSYGIDEDITALYAMAKFEGENLRGNVGVRYVETDTDSRGWDFNNNRPITESGSYDNVLPSVNIVYDLSENVVMRFAAGKSIARPAPFALSYAVNLTPETSSGTAGNPNLKPEESNQYELGIEWYLGNASMLSATYFKKDIQNFVYSLTKRAVINGQEINRLSTFDNGGQAEIEGVELTAQYAFDNGFGFSASYTYSDVGDGVVQDVEDGALVSRNIPFPDASKDVLSGTVYYEQEAFSARLNYSYRSEFFKAIQESGKLFGDEQSQWDAQFNYFVTDNFTLRAEFLNITDETIDDFYSSAGGHNVKATQLYNGRRFILGANYKF